MITHASLFTGIGGFDLAAEWLGWQNIFQVENNKFCQKILSQNFPHTHKYSNIEDFDGTKYKNSITVISGGFPCQPFSNAGKRKGRNDERYLWGEMLRVITEVEPVFVVAENVPGLANIENGLAFKQVLADLESEGYEVLTFDIPAASKNANHRRNRLFIVAYSHNASAKYEIQARRQVSTSTFCDATNTKSKIDCKHFTKQEKRQTQQLGKCIEQGITTNSNLQRCKKQWKSVTNETQNNSTELYWQNHWQEWGIEPTICGNDDGIPNRVDRIKALGNAIVPQVAYELFRNIEILYKTTCYGKQPKK